MSVYFVYRSHYHNPWGKKICKFPEKTLFQWFRNNWKAVPEEKAEEYVKKLMGFSAYGFSSIFSSIEEEDLDPPEDVEELREFLEEFLYVEGPLEFTPHALQVFTEENDFPILYYMVDDHYIKEYPARVSYLLREDWRLPEDYASQSTFAPEANIQVLPSASGKEGSVYLMFLGYNKPNYFPQGYRIDGVRLPGLFDYLQESTPGDGWPIELYTLRAFSALKRVKNLEDCVRAAGHYPISDIAQTKDPNSGIPLWRNRKEGIISASAPDAYKTIEKLKLAIYRKQARRQTIDPNKSLFQVSPHLTQACLHTDYTQKEGDIYQQWILFDDLWASAHRHLVEAMLNYARRWDILSIEQEEDCEDSIDYGDDASYDSYEDYEEDEQFELEVDDEELEPEYEYDYEDYEDDRL